MKKHLSVAWRGLRLLWSMDRRYLLSLTAGSAVTALLPYVPIYFSARLIDALSAGAGRETLLLYAGCIVGLTALLSLLGAWLKSQENIGWQALLRSDGWLHAEKAMSLAYSTIEDRQVALLQERIRKETQIGYGPNYLTTFIQVFIRYAVQIAASVSLTASFFTLSAIPLWARLAFVGGVLLTVAVNILTGRRASRILLDFYASCVKENIIFDKLSDYLSHYTSGKDIRLYHMARPLTHYIHGFYDELIHRELRADLRSDGLRILSDLMSGLLRLGVYLLLISAALSGGLSVGSIAQYVSSVMLLLTAVRGVVHSVQLLVVNTDYLQRYFSYFDIPNPMYQGTLSVEKREDEHYDIEFRDVSFRYPNTETYALRHVSLKLRIGEKLAVVGMNGSGKTTFIKLLCRLYDPTEGTILLNGVDIRKYDYEEYLSLFSVVFQDFRLLSFPLGSNVAAGTDCQPRRAEQCLREAGLEQRLAHLPHGLDTPLYHDFDPQGVEISGGEAQKVAIARALYKNAPFMVLDEPTAALDPVSEYEVYRRFSHISGGRTAVYISHRLASCRFCDEILVFHQGHIVQRGSHRQLLAEENGQYAQLWHAQAQYYTAPL